MFNNNTTNKPYFGTTSRSPFSVGANSPSTATQFPSSPGFASPSSGFGASPALYNSRSLKPKELFCRPEQPNFAEGTNAFNLQPNAIGGNAFSSSGYPSQQHTSSGYGFAAQPEQKGSVIKYAPIAANDMIYQKGIATNINVQLNSIVCMTEYEKKSPEEIRLEDYECNRKGPQENRGTIGAPFNQLENQKFPQVENKTMFGPTDNKAFVQTNLGMNNFTSNQTNFRPTMKPFGLAQTPSPFKNNAGEKPFAFGATNSSLNNFGSPPAAQAPFSFNASTPTTTNSLPTFGTSPFTQTSAQMPNTTNMFSKPQQAFNFSPMGQINTQPNLYQPPKATITNSPFANLSSGGNFQSAPKTQPTFNFPQQPNAPPVQNSIGGLQNPPQGQFTFGANMQPMANNFMNSNKPIALGTQSNFMSMTTPNYSNTLPELASAYKSEEPHTFNTIVENMYESFPYRSIFEGIVVKELTHENVSKPNLLRRIVQPQESLNNPIQDKVKLKFITGSKETPKMNPLKYSWLESTDVIPTMSNTFIPLKKPSKQLLLSTHYCEKLKHMKSLLREVNDDDVRTNIQEKIKLQEAISTENNSTDLQDSSPNNEGGGKLNAAPNDELITIIATHLSEEFKETSPERIIVNQTTNLTPEVPGRVPRNQDDLDNEASTSQLVTPLRTDSSREAILDADSGSDSPSPTACLKLQLEDINNNFDEKIINRLQNTFQNFKSKKSLQMGDHVSKNCDTCGVTLSRKDYYTVPPLDELYKYQNGNGDCLIKGFTVGRYNFGNVFFYDEVNVTNINLDETVQFNSHEAIIYPDSEKKPLPGQGLNRPAQITLDQVWPRHRITHKILRDPKEIEEQNFVERLVLLSRKQNAIFVDYRPNAGSWVFRVEHFSKFSFKESDDDEIAEELARETKKKADIEAKQAGYKGLGGLVNQHVPQPKFFRECSKDVANLKFAFFNDDTNLDTIPHAENLNLATNRNVCRQKRIVKCIPKNFILLGLNHNLPRDKSLVASSAYNSVYGGLFKGQSFRTRWGPGFSFLTGGVSVLDTHNQEAQTNGSSVVKYLEIGDPLWKPQGMYLKEHLEVVFAESTITFKNSRIPLFIVNHNKRSLTYHRDIAESKDENLSGPSFYYSQVWNLCLAFWGPDATTPTTRRELFSKWLETAATPFVTNELNKSARARNIFIYMTGNKISEAAELAEKYHLPNLSILLTEAGSHESSKQLVRHQLEQWNSMGILNTFDKYIIKIYMLLGGIPFFSGINVCENLDWKRVLGIYFWYICPAGTSLINSIRAYTDDFLLGLVVPPTPVDYECNNGRVYDVLYQIMMLFVTPTLPLEKVINPVMYTSDPLDYRLSWFLLQSLTALKVGTISEQVTNCIHIGFSSQLEYLKFWEWAIFVLLFIKDDSYKTKAVMDILERNLKTNRSSLQNTNNEDFFVNHFKIPSEWIHSIIANKTNLMGNHIQTYQHLILAKNWCEARQVALDQLIPDAIINAQWTDLFKLLKRLIPAKQDILHWDTEVGLILDYLEFSRKINNDTDIITEREFTKLTNELVRICLRIKYFPRRTIKQSVAVAELSKMLVNVLRLFYCELQSTTTGNMEIIVNLVKELEMPPDCRHDVLRTIFSIFVKKFSNTINICVN